MTLHQNQKGFGIIEGLLIIVVISIIGGAGYYVYQANKATNESLNNTGNSETAKQENEKSAETEEADPTEGWKEYVSTEGKFSFKYPANWLTADSPELCSEGTVMIAPTKETLGKCASDFGGQVLLSMYTGNETEAFRLRSDQYKNLTETKVEVDGVSGTRQAGVYSPDQEPQGMGPVVGTEEILYVFEVDGNVFSAQYGQRPGFPDVKKEFDLIVTKTLKFN